MNVWESDLVILVSDKNMEWAIRSILSRPNSLQIRSIRSAIYVHPERDPGCLRNGHVFLKSMSSRFAHAIVMFDRMGSGREQQTRESLEKEVSERLENTGWEGRATSVVLSPELEVWIWSDSPVVDRCLGWAGKEPGLRRWLRERGMWTSEASKPTDPKAATELSLREVRKPRSSAVYKQIAEAVSFQRCEDPAFRRFVDTLRSWFPPESQ
jgi:hypothetical protein